MVKDNCMNEEETEHSQSKSLSFIESCNWKLLFQLHSLDNDKIPKHIVSLDKRYLEVLMHVSGFRSNNFMCQAMLHCTWKDGLPEYVFSIDNPREVYTSHLFKTDDDKLLDYVYTFHSKPAGKLEHESDIVGKMKVSTSISLCPNNSDIMETHFILFGSNHNFSNKPKLSGESFEELHSNLDTPDNELAAIIVKDHLSVNKEETGGWGLKFLKNSRTSSSEHCDECSKSIDILIPAGFHGGSSILSGGPSSLTDRWSSGGHCDCGGWDMGCPVTLLNAEQSKSEISLDGEFKTFDFFIQGLKQSMPTMKMTNIHEGLYYIHFQSVLSPLQAFSVAASIIHSHTPMLRPKLYRNQ